MIPSTSLLANFNAIVVAGASGPARLSDRTVPIFGNGTGTVTATYTINSNGNVYNHSGNVLETWVILGSGTDYDIRATKTSGAVPTGSALGVWLNGGGSWSVSAGAGLTTTTTLTLEVRPAGGGANIDTASVTLTADNVG